MVKVTSQTTLPYLMALILHAWKYILFASHNSTNIRYQVSVSSVKGSLWSLSELAPSFCGNLWGPRIIVLYYYVYSYIIPWWSCDTHMKLKVAI